jgi:hypothetical protein
MKVAAVDAQRLQGFGWQQAGECTEFFVRR